MEGKPQPNFSQFLADVLLAPYSPPAMRRLNQAFDDLGSAVDMEEAENINTRVSLPCLQGHHDGCTGMFCWCNCHLLENQGKSFEALQKAGE